MIQHHSIIYVPGLGDTNLTSRQKLLNLWHFRNVSIEICSMKWSMDEPWHIKLDRLINRIDQLKAEGNVVSLIGESAGASAAMHALRNRHQVLHLVILLCGKSHYPERVSPRLYQRNPALKTSLVGADHIVQTLTESEGEKLLNLHPLFDPVVPVAETKISGVRDSTMPMIGHATSIVFANTLWSWRIVHFVRRHREAEK